MLRGRLLWGSAPRPAPMCSPTVFDPAGAATETAWRVPVGKPVITSGFGPRTLASGVRDVHTGTDYDGVTGDPALAPSTGTVGASRSTSPVGSTTPWPAVTIDHGAGIQTRYAHLSAVNVAVGDVVALGDVVAEIGDLGNADGDHLHFEVLVNGEFVDPVPFLEERHATGGTTPTDGCPTGSTGAVVGAMAPAPDPYLGGLSPCNVPDPTNSAGCLTAATAWMLTEAKQAFPEWPFGIGCWGTRPNETYHDDGRACDFMTGPGGTYPDDVAAAKGQVLADWMVKYADELGVIEVIYRAEIWTATEGWHPYTWQTGPTGGHYDHVHVSVNW